MQRGVAWQRSLTTVPVMFSHGLDDSDPPIGIVGGPAITGEYFQVLLA